jgi:hypothetical protein
MFIALQKADAAQRLVYGSFDETPDHAKEVCDYPTAKGAFEEWSAKMSKASDGKSLGNIRGQHSNIAAGKLVEITYDDMAKSIGFVAKIVDDNEWRKVEEGVYTGFSPGGKYAKRWADGAHTRYTPIIAELSVVDVPCNPNAVFTMIKADGVSEEIEFTLSKAYEPGNDATKTRAEDMAKAASGTSFKDHVVQARADLIAENATAELAKMAAGEPEAEPTAEPAAAAPDIVASLTAALAKANESIAASVMPAEPVSGSFADLGKAAAALRLIAAPEGANLNKGLYMVSRVADLMDSFRSIVACTIYEANDEGDGSGQPAKAAEALKAMGELLCMMAMEEVAECMTELPELTPTVMIVDGEVQVMALAQQIVDLVKSDTDLMEKAGKRNSKGDASKIQSMHDNAVSLGATCDTSAAKAEALTLENDRLTKAVESTVPQVEALIATVERLTAANVTSATDMQKMRADLEKYAAAPAPAKGSVMAIAKEDDADLAKGEPVADDQHLTLNQRAQREANRIRSER